jgi:ribose transport system substrate-binding protein
MADGVLARRLSRRWFVLFLTALAACARKRRKTIAVIPKATSHIFWLTVKSGVEAAGREFDVEILWNGPAQETEYSRQMQILDSMISRRVDGIAVAAAERKALLGSLERAAAAGIPLTVFDSGVDSTTYLSFVATDNVEAGRLAARTLAQLIKGKGKVAMLMHAPGSASTMDRERGFTEIIEREFPGIRIVATQYGQSDRAKAMGAAENFLTAHPDLDAIFASSEPSSLGAALAVRSRGLAGKVKVVGFDSSDVILEDLRSDVISAIVVQDPFRMGFEAVRTLVDKLNGKQPPKRIDLPAQVVTKADLDKPEIKKLLGIT